ncbi:META domain-containing protein [Stenotrophomonas sp. ATs4]|uniref:META domain-containing protein n=1 Tax=Stenotrophomonas sp. ATs4 TaxID=3402766 RepID=UPI003F71FB45
MKRTYMLALALLAIGIGIGIGSSTAYAASTPTTAQLEAHLWQLARATDAQGKRIDALFVRGRAPYTLRFQGRFMSELNLCNGSSSAYHLQDNQLVLEGGIMTTAACIRDEVAEQERVAGTLVNARAEMTLALDERGRLLLRNGHGDALMFSPVPLPVK